MNKPNPLQSLLKGFKVFTIAIGQLLSLAAILVGISLIGFGSISILFYMLAVFSYLCSKSISTSLVLEEKKTDNDDDDFNLPLAGV